MPYVPWVTRKPAGQISSTRRGAFRKRSFRFGLRYCAHFRVLCKNTTTINMCPQTGRYSHVNNQ